jgi:hypothetical protein
LSQAQPSPDESEPNRAKFLAWISFDFLVGNEPFQRVALTPWVEKSFVARIAYQKQPHVANRA